MPFAFDENAVRLIRQVVKQVLGETTNRPARERPPDNRPRDTLYATLTEELERGGSAEADVAFVTEDGFDPSGTGETFTVLELGLLPDGVTLPVGTKVLISFIDGVWCLVGFDCDAIA